MHRYITLTMLALTLCIFSLTGCKTTQAANSLSYGEHLQNYKDHTRSLNDLHRPINVGRYEDENTDKLEIKILVEESQLRDAIRADVMGMAKTAQSWLEVCRARYIAVSHDEYGAERAAFRTMKEVAVAEYQRQMVASIEENW